MGFFALDSLPFASPVGKQLREARSLAAAAALFAAEILNAVSLAAVSLGGVMLGAVLLGAELLAAVPLTTEPSARARSLSPKEDTVLERGHLCQNDTPDPNDHHLPYRSYATRTTTATAVHMASTRTRRHAMPGRHVLNNAVQSARHRAEAIHRTHGADGPSANVTRQARSTATKRER